MKNKLNIRFVVEKNWGEYPLYWEHLRYDDPMEVVSVRFMNRRNGNDFPRGFEMEVPYCHNLGEVEDVLFGDDLFILSYFCLFDGGFRPEKQYYKLRDFFSGYFSEEKLYDPFEALGKMGKEELPDKWKERLISVLGRMPSSFGHGRTDIMEAARVMVWYEGADVDAIIKYLGWI